jgi:tyrosyl-tRNA synthetase
MATLAILDDLAARGLIHDTTDRAALAQSLAAGDAGVYCGFDPTADSLHVGNLVGLLNLRRFQLAGVRPVALAGGATGMIGDPSGRSDERNLLDDATLEANLLSITEQLRRFLDFSPGPTQAALVDNRSWTRDVTLIDFLRDVGKHFTINQMVAKESVRSRMSSEAGISFTEFSYMLLQANDFAWLNEHERCVLQIGGSDQWGNITAGIELIRRVHGRVAHGLTWPLITRADGTKFGKSQGGNVWLSATRTSPFRFYQHWLQTDDRDLERFLLQLTLLPIATVRDALEAHVLAPERREGHRLLAAEVTQLVHGPEAVKTAEDASRVVFGGEGAEEPSVEVLHLLIDEIPTARISGEVFGDGLDMVTFLVLGGIAASKSEARRLLDQSGVVINGRRPRPDAQISRSDLSNRTFALVRRGKRAVHLVLHEG